MHVNHRLAKCFYYIPINDTSFELLAICYKKSDQQTEVF